MQTKLSVFCEKVIEAGWLASVVAVPMFFNIYTARTFEPDKITLLRAIVTIMALAWIIMMVERGMGSGEGSAPTFKERWQQWLKTPLFLPTVLIVASYIISTIFSISPWVSVWGSYQRLQGTYSFLSYVVVFALMANTMRTREQIDRFVATVIIASIPVGLYGIIQRYGLDPLPWAGDVTQRVASNLGNAIFLASYLIMVTPLTIARLVESMTAIIEEEKASWGHTVLSAIYIFALAIQIFAILFSGSRGPQLGLLGAGFVMGLLMVLILRRLDPDTSQLSINEVILGIATSFGLLGAGAAVGGVGYAIGLGIESLSTQWEDVTLLGAAIGGLLGFVGLYAYLAASRRGWRWLWISWLSIGVMAIVFVVMLNIRNTPLDVVLDPAREIPYLGRLSQIITPDEGTGRVRVLIWDAAIELIAPHDGLGIPEDNRTPSDPFNFMRPLIGYGPESMFNAFAYVYPPELAYIEARGSSADRSHNETMDSLVITGLFGFLSLYFLMGSLFFYAVRWLGWAPNQPSRWRLIALLLMGCLGGIVIPYLVQQGRLTFVPVGLPFGMVTGVVIHLVVQGFLGSHADESNGNNGKVVHYVILIGALGAIIGHFLEVHFVFSIAATYTYFWAYAGLIITLGRLIELDQTTPPPNNQAAADPEDSEPAPTPEPQPKETKRRSGRRNRRGRRGKPTGAAAPTAAAATAAPVTFTPRREGWETWLGAQGLAMAIIMIILTFCFVTPQFSFEFARAEDGSVNKNTLVIWMYLIAWLTGGGIALSTIAIRSWSKPVVWGRAVLMYSFTSLGYFFLYFTIHRFQFGQRIQVSSMDDVIRAANVLTNGLVIFYVSLLMLLFMFAVMLVWQQVPRGAQFWRMENWWLYPPLIVAVVMVIWFKNINVVRADVYLKEGERYRNARQWDQAIALHELARNMDSDEDFYYLMLALDYQLMAQDNNLSPEQRTLAWQQGEQIALEARNINPYNPDNTGNMGRYYFTLGQILNPSYFEQALDFFEKATVLAPSNVTYHNLWAQTHYIMQNYDAAIDRLQTSVSIDGLYGPTWILLGDTYAAKSDADKALFAHEQAIYHRANFFDQFLDQRLNFYISTGRAEDFAAMLEGLLVDHPTRFRDQEQAQMYWAIGRLYNRMGQSQDAIDYLETALTFGDPNPRTLRELGQAHMTLNQYDEAITVYQQVLQQNPNDVETHSILAFVYAQTGQLDDAIYHNQQVLSQNPEDYDSLKNLAILYQQQNDFQNSLTYAQQAQAVAPDNEQDSWTQFIANLQN